MNKINLKPTEPTIFVDKVKDIINKCLFSLKDKKKNHIHEQKMVAEILETFRSVKKFKDTDNLYSLITSLGGYDKERKEFVKILNIDLVNKHFETFVFSTGKYEYSNFKNTIIFDINTIQFEVIYRQYLKDGGTLHSTQIYDAFQRKNNEMLIRNRKEEIKFGV